MDEETTLRELLKYPEAVEVLKKYKLPCLTCPFFSLEVGRLKIGQVARLYRLDLEGLLRELNEALKDR